MTPRLMVICLGGLAGAGALVCCDLDEGLDSLRAQPDNETAEVDGEADEPAEVEGEASPVHWSVAATPRPSSPAGPR